MTDKQIKQLVEAIDRHSRATQYLANSISEDGSLAEGVFTGLESAAKLVGNGNSSTDMGGIEAFGLHIGDKIDGLVTGLDLIADALAGKEGEDG